MILGEIQLVVINLNCHIFMIKFLHY